MSENKQTKSEEPEVESKEESVVESKEAVKEKIDTTKAAPKVSKEANVVYIGNKPPMNYVMAYAKHRLIEKTKLRCCFCLCFRYYEMTLRQRQEHLILDR